MKTVLLGIPILLCFLCSAANIESNEISIGNEEESVGESVAPAARAADNGQVSESPSSRVCPVGGGYVAGLVEICPGVRAGSLRYHVNDGFFYHRQRACGGRIYLRCVLQRSNPPCAVRAIMDNDRTHFFISSGVHNHGPDEYFNRVVQLRASLLEACRVRPNVRVELIYHDVCRNVAREVSSRVSLLSVRPSMVRAQAEHRPQIPHSFLDLAHVLENNAELRRTLDQEEDLFQGITGQPGHQSVVFMSRRVLLGVGPIQHLFCDGTFYARPNSPDSAQLLTLVTVRDNHVVPLVHALMESRTAQAYQDFFNFLRNFIPTLDPQFIMSDFEAALQLTLSESFPRARISGCLWHYARAVCRNVRSLGLHQLISNNDNARRIVRLSMAIPLAPPGRLQEALNSIVMESRRLLLMNEFVGFFDYIRNIWINGVGDAALSVFGVRHRTNNVAECHHRNINSRLVRRPNIWRFLEMLRESEDTSWRDLGRLEEGYAPSRARRVSSIMSDSRIRSCSRQVMHREMDMIQFLSCVSWRLEGTLLDFFQEVPHERPQSPERAPPPLPNVSNCHGSQTCTVHRGSNPPIGQEMDSDFQAQMTGIRNCSDMVSLPRNGLNRCSVDDEDLYESLMEDPNINPDDPEPVLQGRGRRGSRRGRGGRGARATRGARGPRGTRATRSKQSATGQASRGIPPPRCITSGPATYGRGPATNTGRDQPADSQIPVSQSPPMLANTLPHSNIDPVGISNLRVSLRPDNFSDEEDLQEDDPLVRRWLECVICNERVGHYAMVPCGAYPLCGTCLRHWFITMRNNRCPHCGGPVDGWVRLNQ